MSAPPKILAVDDRVENLVAIEALLRREDVSILRAKSGRCALELLIEHEVALAILDVQMPDLDGFELAELMRGLERTREIPIIFVTAGLHDQARVFKGYESGAVDFLVKPIEPRILRSKVQVFLDLYRQKRQLSERVVELEQALRERRRAESELYSANQRLQALMDAVPVGVSFSDDPSCERVTGNRTVLEQFGAGRDDNLSASAVESHAAGRQVVLLRDGQPIPSAELPLQRAVAEDRAIPPMELEVVLPNGRHWFAETSGAPIHDEKGNVVGGLAVTLDVTERKQGIAALRRSEARLGLLSRTASRLLSSEHPQSVVDELCREVMAHLDCQVFFNFLVDDDAAMLRLNACAGIPDEEAAKIQSLTLGTAICGCAARDRRRIIAERVSKSTDHQSELVRSYGIDAYCCHPLMAQDRLLGTLSFGTRTRPRFDADEIELMRIIADQVATAMERMESNRALSIANAQLIEADRRKDDFLAVLSHELRNPLAPIKNSLYILDLAAPGSDQARRAQAVIGRQVSQLANLVNDLLDVTRVARNKITLHRSRLELNELVRRAVEDNRSLFEKNGIRLEFEVTADPLFVNGDATRLAQAVGNLLQNAAKFTPRGGRTLVNLTAQGREAVCRVLDNGVGMRPETLDRLFEPFMQADQSLDRSKGGLGLGLALVKGLVELHGGRVSAHSEGLGTGAEFTLRLPLDTAPTVAAPVSDHAERVNTRRRVLVIEDNVDAADSLRQALEFSEHQVEVAHSGPDGLARARVFGPEVVLCDIGLPGMDGYEVARAFRADVMLKDVPLVALTGYALPKDLERAAQAGFRHHLPKPPSLDKLEALLARLEEPT